MTITLYNPSENELLMFVLYEKLIAFFCNFGLNVNRTLSVTFTVQKFPKPWYVPLDRKCNRAHQTGNYTYVLQEMK